MTPRCPRRGGQLLREHGIEAPLMVIASYWTTYRKEVMIPRLWKVDYRFLSLCRSALSIFPSPALLSLSLELFFIDEMWCNDSASHSVS